MKIEIKKPVTQVLHIASGLPGKSAYQVAVDAGFEGSEAEWLAGLQGIPGPPTNIEIGDVETLPAGEEAYLRMRGTAPNLILDAGLVSGADGSGGGDSQIYMTELDGPDDFGEGWNGTLYFLRVGNIVSLLGFLGAVEGVATQIVTDKIPVGYTPVSGRYSPAFLFDESEIISTTLVLQQENYLSFPLEANPTGPYIIPQTVYITADDPIESDALDLEA